MGTETASVLPITTMPKPELSAEQRRAFRLPAGEQRGCTEAIMRAHGFKIQLMVDLIRGGLATPVKVKAGRRDRGDPRHDHRHWTAAYRAAAVERACELAPILSEMKGTGMSAHQMATDRRPVRR